MVPEPDQDFSRLRVRAEPEGFVEHCSAPFRHLRMAGWVVDRTLRRPPRELRLRIGGDIRLAVREFQPRPEVSALFPYEDVTGYGWRFEAEVPASALERGATLELEVVDAAGDSSTLYTDTIAAALLRSARLDKHALELRLQEQAAARDAERAEEARRADALHGTIRELEARIAAMRASRFWKLRNAWFRVKRKLGLTQEE